MARRREVNDLALAEMGHKDSNATERQHSLAKVVDTKYS
jgi:hypothetical protein